MMKLNIEWFLLALLTKVLAVQSSIVKSVSSDSSLPFSGRNLHEMLLMKSYFKCKICPAESRAYYAK